MAPELGYVGLMSREKRLNIVDASGDRPLSGALAPASVTGMNPHALAETYGLQCAPKEEARF